MGKGLTGIFVKESIWKFLSSIIGKAGALVFVIIIARFLKPDGFGIYSLAMSISLVFIAFANIGVNQTLVRYVSYAFGRANKKQAVTYAKYLLKIKTFLIVLLSFLLLVLAYPLSYNLFEKPQLFYPLIIVTLYIILVSFESFLEHLFYALKKTKYIAVREIIFQPLRIFFALIVFLILVPEVYVEGIIFGAALATLATLATMIFFLRRENFSIFSRSSARIDKKKVRKFLGYMAIGGLSATFFGYIDTIMLGIFLPSEYIGYYSAAFTLITSIAVLLSVSIIALPIFTQLKSSQLEDAFGKVFRFVCILNIPLIFGTLAVGRYVIKLVYDLPYLPATLPLYFLSPLIFSISISNVLVALFSAREKPQYFVRMLIITAVINIALNYFFITLFLKVSMHWAMAGAAIATLFSRYFYMFSLGIIGTRKFKIRFKTSYWVKPSVSAVVMFSVLLNINAYVEDMTLLIGIGEVILGVFIYGICMVLIKGITKEDFALLKSSIPFRL